MVDHPGYTPRVPCWGEGLSSTKKTFKQIPAQEEGRIVISVGPGPEGRGHEGPRIPNSVREPGSACRQQEVGIFTFKINSWFLSVEHSVLTITHLNPISDFPLLDSPTNVAHFFKIIVCLRIFIQHPQCVQFLLDTEKGTEQW